ncbi:MAG TPA: hypothetical protein VE869_01270, partial [Gemmatimonas sp.]|nr:hypothetical protein [Gemmatimonas sp.]
MSRSDSFPSSVRREWRLLRADRTLWLLGSLFAGLALYAIINGYVWRDTQQRTVLSVQAEESGRLDSLDGVMVRL